MTSHSPPTPIPSPQGGRGAAPGHPFAQPAPLCTSLPPPWGRDGEGGHPDLTA